MTVNKLNLKNISRPEAFQTSISKLVRAKVLELIDHNIGKAVDICCGNGLFLLEYSAKFSENQYLFGIDSDFEAIKEARVLFSDNSFNPDRFINGDGFQLPFADNQFDTVFCLNTLVNFYPFKKIEYLLSELHRICKSGGKIYFDFRNKNNPALRFKYFINKITGRLTTIAHFKSDFKNIFNKLNVKKISFISIGSSINFLSKGILTIIEKQ